VEARHLTPDKKAKPVSPVKPPWILDFLVLARAIEAHCFRKLDVAAKVRIAWRSQQAGGKVTLVEDQTLGVRRAVQPEPAVAYLKLS